MEEGFSNQFSFQKVYIYGEGGGLIWVCVCARVCVYARVRVYFLSFFKMQYSLYQSVMDLAVSDFFELYLSIWNCKKETD